ncbi:MAG: 3-deoxy-7-phosphoheptulonate synthase class II [Pseudobacteriovorax sp.]|nr:3-deoxy-7-phosphoheptulonate synthase class II [Pseudobacteriovorax sp.]
MNKAWTPDSWRNLPIMQQPQYDDSSVLSSVLSDISKLPPLVFVGEVETLKSKIASAARGDSFILQGGDCAEKFEDCSASVITAKLKILLQMSVVLCYGAKKPIVRIGRIAGQYAKPRSNDTEVVDGVEIPVYRGDIINSYEASQEKRKPDPKRIKQAYLLASATLNYIRALTKGGFADLHNPQNWELEFVSKAPKKDEYQKIVSNIQDAINFMESLGTREDSLHSVEFYTSHEGLLLPMEEALTKYEPAYDAWYNQGAHMLWIGDRTRALDGAHIEYFRGIANPVGLKIGPSANPRDIVATVKALNPNNEAGKVTLIGRFGHDKVKQHLPKFVEAIQQESLNVLWSSDPMHGNASKTESGIKTRDFDSIQSELKDSFAIHKSLGSFLGGIHFELTGEDVTECIGGTAGITADQLELKYETFCDPRLNYSQSLEMALLVSEMLASQK